MFYCSPVLWSCLLIRGIIGVSREAPQGRGLIKRDVPIPFSSLGAQETVSDSGRLHGVGANSEVREKYEGWAAARVLMIKAGYDPNSPPPDPFAGMQDDANADTKPDENEKRTSLSTSDFHAAGLVQDGESSGSSDGDESASVSVDASGSVAEAAAVTAASIAVYDESLPVDELPFGGRRRARGQKQIDSAKRSMMNEVNAEGAVDRCYSEWTEWDIWRCVHRECSLDLFKKKRYRKLKSAELLQKAEFDISSCTSKPVKNVHVAMCTTRDTLEPTGIVHGPPESCSDKTSNQSQEGTVKTQPKQDKLDHPGTEEHDYGTLA